MYKIQQNIYCIILPQVTQLSEARHLSTHLGYYFVKQYAQPAVWRVVDEEIDNYTALIPGTADTR